MGDCSDCPPALPVSPDSALLNLLFSHMLWLLSVTSCTPRQVREAWAVGGTSASLVLLGALVLPALLEMGYGLKEESSGRLLGHILFRLSECKAKAGYGPWAGIWAAPPP